MSTYFRCVASLLAFECQPPADNVAYSSRPRSTKFSNTFDLVEILVFDVKKLNATVLLRSARSDCFPRASFAQHIEMTTTMMMMMLNTNMRLVRIHFIACDQFHWLEASHIPLHRNGMKSMDDGRMEEHGPRHNKEQNEPSHHQPFRRRMNV